MDKNKNKTNVMRILEQRSVPYTAHYYTGCGDPEGTDEYGLRIARALGQDPARVFKTLVARGADRQICCFVIPVGCTLDLKKAARAAGEKSVELLHVAEINSVTGYIRGGCSPVGMKKQYTTVFHKTATDFTTVFVSGGRIGTQVELAPDALLQLTDATAADIVAVPGGI